MTVKLQVEYQEAYKLSLLLKIAQEMGLKIASDLPDLELRLVSQSSLSEAWDSEEDERWNQIYKNNQAS